MNTQVKMTDQEMDEWLNTVDQSRIEALVILNNISKGFIQADEIRKMQVLIPICFDAIALLGPKRWEQLLSLHSEKKE
jgi:hypothetical protein